MFRTFATAELLFKTLTAKREAIVRALVGRGPMSIREVARRVGRDVKAVHGDVVALLEARVLQRSATGQIECPYDKVRINYVILPQREEAA